MVTTAVSTPLLAADPTRVLDLPGLVRATVAFAVVLALGAVLLWRYDGLIDRSIGDAVDRPVAALGYGVAAHLTIAFFGVYSASQLGQFAVSGRSLGAVGIWLGLAVLVVVGAVGFTVVGAAVVEYGWERRPWHGLLVGAAIAGLAALADPLVGGLVWIVVVSTGVGGRVRVWFHASMDAESAQ